MRTTDQLCDTRELRRLAADDRAIARIDAMLDRREKAAQMIGHLNSGRHYVCPVGGKYREGTDKELIDFLIRNNYA